MNSAVWCSHVGCCFCVVWLIHGCAPSIETGSDKPRITVEVLYSFESLLPITPDSVAQLYKSYDPGDFYKRYRSLIGFAGNLIDSLNVTVDPSRRIDTLAIDHTMENFGTAARSGRSVFVSSSYFFLFESEAVLRSVITHEYGHLHFDGLSAEQQETVAVIWQQLNEHALFYLFRDGEYSGNARFGGHPYESPAELFASAFNLFHNKSDELDARLSYVAEEHRDVIRRLRRIVMEGKR
jgi:hypothetical protein